MMYLCRFLIFICVISNLETKNLQKQSGVNDGLDNASDDWSQRKWRSIFNLTRSSECSNEFVYNEINTKSSNVANSYGEECINKIKNLNDLEDLSEDQALPVEVVHKENEVHKSDHTFAVENYLSKDQVFLVEEQNETHKADYTSTVENNLSEDQALPVEVVHKENEVHKSDHTSTVENNLSKDQVFPVVDVHKEKEIHKYDNFFKVENKDSDQIVNPTSEENEPEFSVKEPVELSLDTSKALSNSTKKSSNPEFSPDSSFLDNSRSFPFENLSGKESSSFSKVIHRDILINTRSFVFNPVAQSREQFQNCTTPKNESGNCRYLQHCMIPSILGSINNFMKYVCIIKGSFIGVCCPNLPATVLVVKDQKGQNKTKVEATEECGISTNTRIVGGTNADPKAWPWMVALLKKSRNNFFCGGALINHRYVLTAAHCTFGVSNNEIIARFGEYDFRDDIKFQDEVAVVEIKRHGHYNRRTLRNDIALLKLEKPVVFNEFIKQICLPEGEKSYVGEMATLVGWGNVAANLLGGGTSSHILQEASFPVQSNEECSNDHGIAMQSSMICTSSKADDKGACNGDSGGPLMLLDQNNHWKVIGLVSWGRRGCNPEFPTVYTRVSHFLGWINKHSSV